MAAFDWEKFQEGTERMRRDAAAVRHAALRSRELGRLEQQFARQKTEALEKQRQPADEANMSNGTFDKDEFWAALGRLYNDTLVMKEAAERSLESIVQLRAETSDLLAIARIHQDSLVKHEKRLDRTEVTVEAILEDLRRHRENRPPA